MEQREPRERLGDRRVTLPATKSCVMCGWKMVRTGEWFVCTNRGCEREDRAA